MTDRAALLAGIARNYIATKTWPPLPDGCHSLRVTAWPEPVPQGSSQLRQDWHPVELRFTAEWPDQTLVYSTPIPPEWQTHDT